MNQERVVALVEQVIRQEGAAFTELYDETVRSVYRLVYLLAGFRSDADDITQETYIQLYKSLPKYDVSKSFKPWLIGLIIHVVNQYWRQQQRLNRIQRKAASENGYAY
ncbi:sigma-70 family RNA polymerase sigma factor [Paenibacillus ginsengarvi]|uniref:Sigma-70 family RNA polymerase sigma factor n=1 Tax=Paenibacillus ginsengarvi TaxID=400777 RepID=A0A3B0CM94_9BACL|nr:sigma-70 family RNA polymerase sigma factor [Paenibacillus ginsengarvi]RKN86292.1 sigma-70 family RNA polymerase sigma factor [Paenibacillus ginsengarvi]